jgi:hypothetical protein
MTTEEKKLESIVDQINNLDTEDLIRLHNSYCKEANYSDNEIYGNDEDFFETFFSNNVIDAVRAASHGEYNFSENYVKFDGNGNLESFNYFGTDDLIDEVYIIADFILENENDFDGLIDLDEVGEDEEED